MWNAGLDEAQTRIKISGRNINSLWYVDDITFVAESKELRSLLREVKEESEKVGLEFSFQKAKRMAWCPNGWENNGNSERLYFWGAPKSLQMVTAAMKVTDACSLEKKSFDQPW